jgi:diguanylate cyclase (GGDEF)-like protein
MLWIAFYLISRFINRPLKKLTLEVSQANFGNLDVHVDLDVKDELGLLAKTFNKMTKDLKESIEQNEQQIAENKRIAIEHLEQINMAYKRSGLMLDAMPLCSVLWDRELRIVDCNEAAVRLFELSSKQEFMNVFLDLSPALQPDGQASIEKILTFLKKAFEEGSFIFDWMHKLPNGASLPMEITLNRVVHEDYYVIVAFAKDLRNIREMENNIRWLEKEAEKVYFDPLTGIHNRRYLDENLSSLIKNLSRSSSEISLLMIDIDFFKVFNDTYGHTEGDKCLTAVAKTLAKALVREADFVARYGGEEFTAVLPSTDMQGAHIFAEKLLEAVRDCNIPHEKNLPAGRVTISIGAITGTAKHDQSGEDYIKQADGLLYQAKQGGRDRCKFAAMKLTGPNC